MIKTFLTTLLILIGSYNVYGTQGIPWDNLRSTYMDYLEHPTKQNADKLLTILPTRRPDASEEMNETLDIMYKAYPRLSELALTGKDKAVEILFKLLVLSDGAFSEDVSIDLGSSINKDPEKFLRYLKQYRKNIQRLDTLLGNLGPDYADELEPQLQELKKRKKNIESVKSPGLSVIRDECIEVIDKQIMVIEKLLNDTSE